MTKRRRTAKGRAAEPKHKVSLAPMPADGSTQWDMGAPGPANRNRLQREERGALNPETGKVENPNGVTGMRVIDNLQVWHNCFLAGKRNRAWITTAQFNTAVRIRSAFERTQQAPGTDYRQTRVDSSPKPDHAIGIQIDRMSAFHRVMGHIRGADAAIIWHCVILDQSPSTFRIRGERPFSGEGYQAGWDALRAALDRAE